MLPTLFFLCLSLVCIECICFEPHFEHLRCDISINITRKASKCLISFENLPWTNKIKIKKFLSNFENLGAHTPHVHTQVKMSNAALLCLPHYTSENEFFYIFIAICLRICSIKDCFVLHSFVMQKNCALWQSLRKFISNQNFLLCSPLKWNVSPNKNCLRD